jgi:hypothetical protein
MRGFPKYINTKADIMNLLPDYPDEVKAFLQGIIDPKELNYWRPTGQVASEADGITDATHRVYTMQDEMTDTVRYIQQELVEDPNSRIYRLGFTDVAEVEGIINGN